MKEPGLFMSTRNRIIDRRNTSKKVFYRKPSLMFLALTAVLVKKDISLLLVLYEADEKDEAFVNQLNEKNEYQLSLSDFEYVMDTLERIQGSEVLLFVSWWPCLLRII
jgi:hypothetical protein